MVHKYLNRVPPGLFSAVVTLAILWLTLAPQPLPDNDVSLFEGADKVVHALMFGGLVFAMVVDRRLLCDRRRDGGYKMKRQLPALLCMAAAATVFGGLIELFQGWMAMGRGCDPLDFLADAVGSVISAVVSPWLVARL